MTETRGIGFAKAAIMNFDDTPINPEDISLITLNLYGEGFVAEAKVGDSDIYKVAGSEEFVIVDKYTKVDSKRWIGKEKESESDIQSE